MTLVFIPKNRSTCFGSIFFLLIFFHVLSNVGWVVLFQCQTLVNLSITVCLSDTQRIQILMVHIFQSYIIERKNFRNK